MWGREVGLAGVGCRDGEKMQTTVIEQQFKKSKKLEHKLRYFVKGGFRIFHLNISHLKTIT